MLRDRFQVLPSQARRLLSVLDCVSWICSNCRCCCCERENLDSVYRDLSLPHARRLALRQAALRDSRRDRELLVNSAWTR